MIRLRTWLTDLRKRMRGVERTEGQVEDHVGEALPHVLAAEDPPAQEAAGDSVLSSYRRAPSEPPVYYAEVRVGDRWSPRTYHGGPPSTSRGRIRSSEGTGAQVRNVGLLPADLVGLGLDALQAELVRSNYAFAELPAPKVKKAEVERAVVRHERLGLIAGRVVDRHGDGSVTIDYAGLLRLQGVPQEGEDAAS